MARAQDQQRWRENSGKKRIEIMLPAAIVTALDVLAAERGSSRAVVVGQLIADRPTQTSTAPPDKSYRLRKPTAGEGFDWIVIVDGAPIAGVERSDDIGWRARYLRRSTMWRWSKRRTRDDTVRELLDAPDIYG